MIKLIRDIYFELLGVNRSATKDEIKKAYRNQIKIWHPDKLYREPDKLEEAVERSKRINEAYKLLENYDPTKYSKESRVSNSGRLILERKRVKSSNIYSVGYHSDFKTLQVQFNSGAIYQYYDVPSYIYEELMASDSKGKYLNRNIAHHFKYD